MGRAAATREARIRICFSVSQMNNLLRVKAEEEERNQKLKDKIWEQELAAILQKAIWDCDRPQTK